MAVTGIAVSHPETTFWRWLKFHFARGCDFLKHALKFLPTLGRWLAQTGWNNVMAVCNRLVTVVPRIRRIVLAAFPPHASDQSKSPDNLAGRNCRDSGHGRHDPGVVREFFRR
jgi:hypothetical protein